MLIEQQKIKQITIDEHGNINVQHVNRIIEDSDGTVKAETYHRQVIMYGDTVQVDSILGDRKVEIKALAGKDHGGWNELVKKRQAEIDKMKEESKDA